jgi:hypothetical protein
VGRGAYFSFTSLAALVQCRNSVVVGWNRPTGNAQQFDLIDLIRTPLKKFIVWSGTTPQAGIARVGMLMSLALLALAGCGGSSSSSSGGSSAIASGGNGPATVSLSASRTLVSAGDRVTLRWSSSNADSCTASGGWSGSKALTGSELVGPLSGDTTFLLSCSGGSGGGVQQVTVKVGSGSSVIVSLDSDPDYVLEGGTTTLSWESVGADQCVASGGWSGERSTSGTFTTGPITETTGYQLQCTGSAGSGLAMLTVQVVDKTLRWQAPTENVDGSDLTDLAGFVIYWGRDSRNYTGQHTINSPTATQWEADIPPGTYFFAMTAFDSENNESAYSNEVYKIIP